MWRLQMEKIRQAKKKASELDLKQKDLDVDDENDPDWIASKDKIDSSSDDDDDDDIGECQSRSIKHKRKKIDSSDDETDDYGYAETKKKQRKKGKKIGKRSTEEKQCVECAFQKDILLKRIPGKKQCQELIDKNVVLKNRSWTMVKNFVRNQIVSLTES